MRIAADKFIKCGNLREGFARVRCDDCGKDMFASFSCKVRCFCPSCHKKRVLELSIHVREEVFAEVPHRQFVFTLPKRLLSEALCATGTIPIPRLDVERKALPVFCPWCNQIAGVAKADVARFDKISPTYRACGKCQDFIEAISKLPHMS